MGHPVVHFEVGGNDRKQLERFYGQVFDWKIHSHDEMHYGLVEAAGRGIGGGISGAIPNGPSSWVTFYVQVDDLEASLKMIESAGGKTLVPPTPIPNTGSFAWFSDPAGNCIGLFREGV